MSQLRNVCFTIFGFDEGWESETGIKRYDEVTSALKGWEAVEYCVMGKEICPDTQRPHLQCYMELDKPKKLSTIKNILPGVHLERRMGPQMKAVDYCKKDGDFVEWGVLKKQGNRTDLKELCEEVRLGKRTIKEIANEDPDAYHQYGRTLHKIHTFAEEKRFRTEMTKGVWIWGPSGIGKSHRAFEGYDSETHYVKNLNEEWWDGYYGQEVVIFNEFRGQIKFSELLDLADKWPKTVKIKYFDPVQFRSKKLIITSCMHPKDCFRNLDSHENWAQFNRRFEIIDLQQELNEACNN